MKFFISIDLEGCAGVVGMMHGTLDDSKNYTFACEQAVMEANAAARALFDCGAEEVVICDGHGDGTNLDYRKLDPRCKILMGTPMRERFCILQNDFDGMLLMGYHGMEGSPSVLAHSFNSRANQYIKVNGKMVGEIDIDAIVAGSRGVPVIFVSSDDVTVSEARQILPYIRYVETKQSLGHNYILSKNPQSVLDEIYTEVKKAANEASKMAPYLVEGPYQVEIRFTRAEDAEHAVKHLGFSLLDSHTVARQMDDLGTYF